MRRIFLILGMLVCFGSLIACGKEKENPQTYVVEDILLGETSYREMERTHPELCKSYWEYSKVWNEKKSMYEFLRQPSAEGEYVLNDVEGTMDLYYSKKGYDLITVKFSPDELTVENMSKLQDWLENQYADFTVSSKEDEYITTWSNGEMDVKLHAATRNETECSVLYIDWNLCE